MTAGFYLCTSDDIRQLAAQYSRLRQDRPEQFYDPDLFVRETIVIPSRAMRQWLERTLVDQGFFLANVDLLSLRSFISKILDPKDECGSGEEFSAGAFGRKTMVWRIMDVLRKHPGEFPELTGYLKDCSNGESEALRCYSLADKIANLFCRYIEETPELLARSESFGSRRSGDFPETDSFWKAGHWQAMLWRRLCVDGSETALRSPADRIIEFLTGSIDRPDAAALHPITVFGVGSMAPASLAVLKKLAKITAVNFFCLNPSDAKWPEDSRRLWEEGKLHDEPEEVKSFFEFQIMGQWGRHQRYFFKTVLGLAPILGVSPDVLEDHSRVWLAPATGLRLQERFSETKSEDEVARGPKHQLPHTSPPGLLQGLRKNLLEPGSGGSGFAPDDSITVHDCHNPAREVEVLRDHLLHLIQTGGYTNSDILVAAPDITVFEPYVKAVFDQPVAQIQADGTTEDCRLSYSFSGLGVHRSNPIGESFLRLLDVGRSRYELPQIEKLLMTPEVRKRFGLEDADLQAIKDWCRSAGIYWGADGKRQDKYGVPDYESFSWRYGLDRMLLGFALESDEKIDTLWGNVAPFDGCDSVDGRPRMRALLEFFRGLRRTEELTRLPAPVGEWKTRLNEVISAFFAPDLDRKAFYRGLVLAVNLLCKQVENSGYSEEIPPEVIRRGLSDLISVPVEDENFLNGSITFCNLRDARGIPCKVLCLLGMDEGAYPNSARPDSFDLIRGQMDATYRSSRFQDRYFFLESLLGVQDRLLIYYRGQDDVMDKKFSPATVISELTAYISGIFGLDEKKLHISQSLLPYSHDYFRRSGGAFSLNEKWSFNRYAHAIDRILNSPKGKAAEEGYSRQSYLQADLLPAEPRDSTVTVDLSDLEAFFRNAGFVFLEHCFSFPRPTDFGESRDRDEPVDPDSLEEWKIKDFLSRWLLEMIDPEKFQGRNIKFEDIEETDEILTLCHEHLCRLNRLAPGGGGRGRLEAMASASWIGPDRIRDAWSKFCLSRENRSLQLPFENSVVQLPDEPLRTDFACDWSLTEKLPRYSKVILQYSTRKPLGVDQVLTTLGGTSSVGRNLSRLFIRHLFFVSSGEEKISSYLITKDVIKEYCGIGRATANELLQKILAFYLYGRRHPLPIMENGMWKDDPAGAFRDQRGFFGDFKLEYVRLLWGDEKIDGYIVDKILELQNLRVMPGEYDPNATPTE